MLTKNEATKLGKNLLKKMKGKGWKLDIWENLGWHYCATNGPLSIYGSEGQFYGKQSKVEKYWCLMSDKPKKAHVGSSLWTLNGNNSKFPKTIIKNQVKEARKVLNEITQAVEIAEKILKEEEKS